MDEGSKGVVAEYELFDLNGRIVYWSGSCYCFSSGRVRGSLDCSQTFSVFLRSTGPHKRSAVQPVLHPEAEQATGSRTQCGR